jgi:hypothetical protein
MADRWWLQTCAGLLCLLAAGVRAEGPAADMNGPVSPPPGAAADGAIHIPARTVVRFEIVPALGSAISHIDDVFAIRLVEPVMIDGRIALPAGTMGQGQIIQAAKAGWGGKAGELIVTVRYLESGGTHVPLGHFQLDARGADRSHAAFVAATVVAMPMEFLISGGEVVLPAGTRATARVTADTDIAPTGSDTRIH